jgi:hypothetical protein
VQTQLLLTHHTDPVKVALQSVVLEVDIVSLSQLPQN